MCHVATVLTSAVLVQRAPGPFLVRGRFLERAIDLVRVLTKISMDRIVLSRPHAEAAAPLRHRIQVQGRTDLWRKAKSKKLL